MEAVFDIIRHGECRTLYSEHGQTRPPCLPGGDVGSVFPQGRGGAQLYLLAEVEEGPAQHTRHVRLVKLHSVILTLLEAIDMSIENVVLLLFIYRSSL